MRLAIAIELKEHRHEHEHEHDQSLGLGTSNCRQVPTLVSVSVSASAFTSAFTSDFLLLHLLLHASAFASTLAPAAPYSSGRRSGSNPIGAARMDARRFSKGQGRPFEKFPDGLRIWSAQRGRREDGVCFLLVTVLCTSKEQ
ncbi:hypothetical protein NY751_01970 [Xanthomonas campestris]|uniref:hypothetical protein n=1 Tax=Xanthomonas campestris TaxID=339 RepID=UPI002358732D|nr:hypothetical protein [Xanthomonas campestris]MDC8744873.1 hypothetical protein [Xanthomonas campestris]